MEVQRGHSGGKEVSEVVTVCEGTADVGRVLVLWLWLWELGEKGLGSN